MDALQASEIVQQVTLASKKILQKPLVFGTLGNSDAMEDYYQEITSNWDMPTEIDLHPLGFGPFFDTCEL